METFRLELSPNEFQLHTYSHMMKRKYIVISQSDPSTEPPPPVPGPAEEEEEDHHQPETEEYDDDHDQLAPPQPPDWFTRVVLLQADLIYNSLSLLFSPISSLLYLASDSYHRAEEAKETMESGVHRVPFNITHGGVLLFRKLGMGFLGAAYVCMVLIVVMAASVVVGVGLVRVWVDEPVLIRERLHFDYTDLHPKAVLSLRMVPGLDSVTSRLVFRKARHVSGVPVGHTFQVSLVLLMPDSDYNRQIGVFQLTAELLTDTGQVFAKSSQPCMLRFRSLPVRLARVFLLGVPLLLGVSAETQKVRVEILKHKEASIPRTDAIRATLIPRAGTFSPPQLYEAEILINSQLPWPKKLVHNWKWTFYVWVSLYTYTVLLLVLLCCCKPLLLSGPVGNFTERRHLKEEVPLAGTDVARRHDQENDDVSELLRKLRRNRSRRKAMLMAAEAASASSMSVTKDQTSTTMSGLAEDDFGDSESVC